MSYLVDPSLLRTTLEQKTWLIVPEESRIAPSPEGIVSNKENPVYFPDVVFQIVNAKEKMIYPKLAN